MAWRIALVGWGILGTVGAAYMAVGGSVEQRLVLEGLGALGALVAIWLVVKLPWDLYFGARYVEKTQADSVAREVKVAQRERDEARGLARRLLVFCIGLHLLGAAVAGVATVFTDGFVGPMAVAGFVLSMGVRPATAMVGHVRRRLKDLGRAALVPPTDAASLDHRVRGLERFAQEQRRAHEKAAETVEQLSSELALTKREAADGLALVSRRHADDVRKLCTEFERSVERLTSDQALLHGIRAFLQMVRDQPDAV